MDLKTLLHYLNDSPVEIKRCGTTTFYVDNTRLTPNKAVFEVHQILRAWYQDDDKFMKLLYEITPVDPTNGALLIEQMKKDHRKRMEKLAAEKLGDLKTALSFKHVGLNPIRDVQNGERGLFDSTADEVALLDFDTWYENCAPDKEGRETVMGGEILGLIKYNPYSITSKRTKIFKGQEIYEFNSHVPPAWRKVEPPKSVKPPKFWTDVMEHLFPDAVSRRFVYHWLYTMLTTRNQTALLLVSVMGTGKGVFLEIVEQLVGSNNFQKQGEGYFKSQFNLEIKNKRCIAFDEVALLLKYKEAFKFLLNNNITVEGKGQNVDGTIENFASFIITNNQMTQNFLVSKDRRFSVPDITDIPLNEVIKESEVDAFMVLLQNDPSIIEAIGWDILINGQHEEYTEFTCFKGKKFYELTVLSLSEWQRFIYGTIIGRTKDKYSFSDLKFEYEDATGSKKFPGEKSMQTFLNQFRDIDKALIADVDKLGKDFYVIPRAKYAPEPDFSDI